MTRRETVRVNKKQRQAGKRETKAEGNKGPVIATAQEPVCVCVSVLVCTRVCACFI